MANDTKPTPSNASDDPAALAFEALREEVALVRRAVDRLTAECTGTAPPDYSETLGKILRASAATAVSLRGLAEAPARRVDPKSWGRALAVASEDARRADHEMLAHAREVLQRAAHDLAASSRSARQADSQRRWLLGTAIAGLFAGMILWPLAVGAIARSMPESWQWPERMAAQIVGLDPEAAGARLIATAAPQHWHDIVLGYHIVGDNRDAIKRCETLAAKEKKPVRCIVRIGDMRLN